VASQKPVENGGSRTAYVQVSGGTWCKARNNVWHEFFPLDSGQSGLLLVFLKYSFARQFSFEKAELPCWKISPALPFVKLFLRNCRERGHSCH
jgi:hypothetical protein